MIVLESERLLFRQHEADDLEAFCAMEMDPDVRRYVGGRPRSREEAEERFRRGALRPVTDRLAVWASVLKPQGVYVGRCGLYPHFKADGGSVSGEATLGLYIARDYWGRGLASEAARAFVRFGWDELLLSRIVAAVQLGNDASVRVLEKAGFELVEMEHGPRSFLHFAVSNPNSNGT